jgi:hypothetical protein
MGAAPAARMRDLRTAAPASRYKTGDVRVIFRLAAPAGILVAAQLTSIRAAPGTIRPGPLGHPAPPRLRVA